MGMLGKLYSSAMELRNYAFEKEIIKSESFNKPIISVGNISMGGTGKTPMVVYLVESLQKQNLKAGIVSRGYGGSYSGVQKVSKNCVSQFGDEMSMLQSRYPETPIYVCKKRVLAIKQLIDNEDIDIIIADDGFQHRYFKRNIDIVLIDSTDHKLKVFPSGRLREPLKGLSRADIVVITRSVSEDKGDLYHKICKYVDKSKIFWSKTMPTQISSFNDESVDLSQNKNIVLFSGIGNPKSFEESVKELSIEFSAHKAFRDHFNYSQKSIYELEKKYPEASFLCTEKDFIKIDKLQRENKYYYLKINTEIIGRANEFDSKIRTLIS